MKLNTIIFVVIVVFLCGSSQSVLASTEITQSFIDEHSLVPASGGPYALSTEIVIPSEKEVSVEAGTTLRFTGGQMRVHGMLKIDGTASKPVRIELGSPSNLGAAINVLEGRVYMNFANVSGTDSIIESIGGTVEVLHSHFEDVESGKTLIVSYASSSISLADNSFSKIRTPHVLEVYNNSRGMITQSMFTDSGNQSVVSVFDGSGVNDKSNVSISDSVFKQSPATGVEVFGGASLILEDVSISESGTSALSAYDNGKLTVKNSSLEGNNIGIEAYRSSVILASSSVERNSSAGIVAYGSSVIASTNWWGSETGPYNEKINVVGKGQSVTDDVAFLPWLKEKPSKKKCCSSILFLPGLEGSRLYVKSRSENQLWEPNTNADVKKLFLDSSGNSLEKNIYTRDVIGKTNIVGPLFQFDVYGGFTDFLKNLVSSGTITAWKPFPYDWRRSSLDIANETIYLDKGATTSLGSMFDDLVKESKTGKVSIVAHSNGGLVAKNFVNSLIATGKVDKVDQLIMVAVPEYGTPQAVAGLLHGDSQSILGGIILSKSTARNLGINMPSAYELLPTQKFFDSSSSPVVTFPTGSDLATKYGSALTTRQRLTSFLAATGGDRKSSTKIDEPSVLNSGLLKKSEEVHKRIDDLFNIPLSGLIEVTSIVGVGSETLTGLNYEYVKKGKKMELERSRTASRDGDGVVLAGVPVIRSGNVYSVDLRSLSLWDKKNYQHANILNASSIQRMISLLVKKDLTILPPFVSKQATSTNSWRRYEFAVHSPVSILAYDTNGNRTGLLKEATEDEIGVSVEEIPGSQYVNFGEAKTIITSELPSRIVLHGLDTGTFRFNATEFQGDSVLKDVEYSNVPTIEGMTAEFIPASSSVMTIDYNADGEIDEQISPDTQSREFNLSESIASARLVVSNEVQSRIIREIYLKKLDGMAVLLKKGSIQKVAKQLASEVEGLAKALKVYNRLQKNLKIGKLMEPVVRDTTVLFYQFQRLNSEVGILGESQ
jgi:hypothetical protein